MFEYKNVKIALEKFLEANLGLDGNTQIFRALPNPTELTAYPVVYIRTATASQPDTEEATRIEYTLSIDMVTRSLESRQDADDELNDLLQKLDIAIATIGVRGLDQSLAGTGCRWLRLTRLGTNTDFEVALEPETGVITFGTTAQVKIIEQTPVMG